MCIGQELCGVGCGGISICIWPGMCGGFDSGGSGLVRFQYRR